MVFKNNEELFDHLIHLEAYIRDAFVHKQHVVAVFFDLEKAYNMTWKYGVLTRSLKIVELKDTYQHSFKIILVTCKFKVWLSKTLPEEFEQDYKKLESFKEAYSLLCFFLKLIALQTV